MLRLNKYLNFLDLDSGFTIFLALNVRIGLHIEQLYGSILLFPSSCNAKTFTKIVYRVVCIYNVIAQLLILYTNQDHKIHVCHKHFSSSVAPPC